MIVLLGHGSPDLRHRAGVDLIAARMGAGRQSVGTAYLQHHGPTLTEAVRWSKAGGEVVVLPLFLARGVHQQVDVPECVDQARDERPDLRWQVLEPLPPVALAPVVAAAVASVGGASSAIGVVAGSARPGALDALGALTEELAARGLALAVANGPGDEVIEAFKHLGGRPVVVPLMFANGVLNDVAARTARGAGLTATAPIGESAECATILAEWADRQA